MTRIQEIENLNKINHEDFQIVMESMFESLLIKREYKSLEVLEKKEELLDMFSSFIEKYLEMRFGVSGKNKIQFINLIDKLNLQREALEYSKDKNSYDSLKVAAERLGKKSQSAFSIKY